MAVINATTNIATMLAVYPFKSIDVFAADLPPRNMFTLNFDDAAAGAGQQVITRIPSTTFATTANNLANGWGNTQPSSSNVSMTLNAKGFDHPFNVVTWETIGEAQLINTFGGFLQKQVANAIFVDAANLITSSTYTNVCYVQSSSLFNLTGSLVTSSAGTGNTGLQAVGTLLDNLEITQVDRYGIINPNAYQGLISGIYQQYVLGNDRAVVGNGFVPATERNQAWPGIDLAGFDVFKHPRINSSTAKVPYGGPSYSSNDTLVGWAGVPAGLCLAARPFEIGPAPMAASVAVIDPTSGFPLTYVIAWDSSLPGWRVGVYGLYAVAAGNTNAIVEIIAKSS